MRNDADLFDVEVEAVQRALHQQNDPLKGRRVVDWNAMREAQVVCEVDEQILRGSYRSPDSNTYAEPAEAFEIDSAKVPGMPDAPDFGCKPRSWAATTGTKKHEKAVAAAKKRAEQFAKEETPKSPKVAVKAVTRKLPGKSARCTTTKRSSRITPA